MKYKILVTKGKRQWYWKLIHKNGHDVSTSETYSSKFKACQTAFQVFSLFKRGVCKIEVKGGKNGYNKYTR